MSVPKIVDKGAKVIYDSKKATVQSISGATIFTVPRVQDLYIYREQRQNGEKNESAAAATEEEQQ
jgi:hypothetical protein